MKHYRRMTIPILLAAVLSCSSPTDRPEEEGAGGAFPHESGYAGAEGHQAYLAQNQDVSECAPCHGASGDGGWTEIACTGCHESFPHGAGAASPEVHAVLPGVPEDCSGCHGQDYGGGDWAPGCVDCHASYPHPEGYASPANHPVDALANGGLDTCDDCHGEMFGGGIAAPSCYTCHNFPHTAGWMAAGDANFHGEAVLGTDRRSDPDKLAECGECHGADLMGGANTPGCNDCHSAWPHPSGFAAGHPDFVAANSDTSCATNGACHAVERRDWSVIGVGCTNFCHVTP